MNYNSYGKPGEQSSNSPQTTDWDSLQNVDYNPETAEKLAKDPIRRKAEIANYLLTNEQPTADSTNLLSKNDIEEAYRAAVRSEDGLNSKETAFMKQIDTPLGHDFENSQNVFSSLDYHERKILSHLSGIGFDNYEQGRPADLNTLISRFPTPSALIPQMNQLLNLIVNPAKAQEYAEDFNNFGRKVYGERYEYSKAFDEIYDDAENYHLDKGWNVHINTGRPHLLYASEPDKSQPLENSPYHSKALDDQLEAGFRANRQRAAEEAEKNQRLNLHAAKIVTSFTSGEHVADIDQPATSAGAREAFYGWLNDGQLTSANESQFLRTLKAPVSFKDGFVKVYGQLDSENEHSILAYASGNGFGPDAPTTIDDLRAVFERFPTPVEFQPLENGIVNHVKQNAPDEIDDYQKALETFKQKFYGKRQEYHEAWQKLEQEAQAHQERQRNFVKQMQSTNLDYQPPEALSYLDNLKQQIETPNSADRRVVIKPRDPDTTKPEPKKGIFGKIFGRKG